MGEILRKVDARLAFEAADQQRLAVMELLGHNADGDLLRIVLLHIGHDLPHRLALALLHRQLPQRLGGIRLAGQLVGHQAVVLQLLLGKADGLLQLGGHHRLEKIPLHAAVHGALGVVEVGVARDHDGHEEVQPPGLEQRVQSVHQGHVHVQQHDIRPVLADHLRRLLAVGGLQRDAAVQSGPVRAVDDALPDQGLVLRDQNLEHVNAHLVSSAVSRGCIPCIRSPR